MGDNGIHVIQPDSSHIYLKRHAFIGTPKIDFIHRNPQRKETMSPAGKPVALFNTWICSTLVNWATSNFVCHAQGFILRMVTSRWRTGSKVTNEFLFLFDWYHPPNPLNSNKTSQHHFKICKPTIFTWGTPVICNFHPPPWLSSIQIVAGIATARPGKCGTFGGRAREG